MAKQKKAKITRASIARANRAAKIFARKASHAIRTLTELGLIQWCQPETQGVSATALLQVRLCFDDEGDGEFFNVIASDDTLYATSIAAKDILFFKKLKVSKRLSAVVMTERNDATA